MNRQLGIVWHPGRTQSRAAEKLVELMKEIIECFNRQSKSHLYGGFFL